VKLKRHRILETRVCLWCHAAPVYITTAATRRRRALQRFCSRRCARLAGGLTHGSDWVQQMCRRSAQARKAKAQAAALALLAAHPPDVAVALIRKQAYEAGWAAGNARGVRIEHARVYRALKRVQARKALAKASRAA